MVSVWGELCQDCQKQKSEIFKLKGDKCKVATETHSPFST